MAMPDDVIAKVRVRIVQDLAAGRVEIPPFPRVAMELHKIAVSPNPDLFLACKIIQREVELAGRIVKAACSPLFGRRAVDTLDAAAARLGVEGLRDIAMMASMGKLMRSSPLLEQARATTIHSFSVAVLTQWVCAANRLDKKQGFLCGLFHDVGRLALIIVLEQYGRQDPIYLEPDMVRIVCERLHAQVGAVVLSSWGVHNAPKFVAEHHHDALKAIGNDAPFARAVAIADAADKLLELDVPSRIKQLSVDPVVVAAGIKKDLIETLAVGVDTVRADDMLVQMTT